jgi:CubicO group peptidase (beta-lactamase class C family)
MSAFGFSGAVIVEKDNQVILRKGYGFANKSKQIPFTADTPFPAQSIAKQFTAASILKLEEQGKLSVNDSISKYLIDVPEDKKTITIHQLLTHTSGFTNDYSGTNIFNREDVITAILKNPLGNPIGEKMSYNNDGFELLAAIFETVSKQNLHQFIRQNFFVPVGMKSTGFQGDGKFWKDGIVAHGYNSYFDNGSPQFIKPDWDGYGSGDIVTSVNDLYKWELSFRKNEILSANIKNKMTTPYSDYRPNWKYGYGWFVIKSDRGTTEYYHGGGDIPGGYTASYTRYPDEKMTIIIFANTMIDELGFLNAVKPDITDIAFGKNVEMPPKFNKAKVLKLKYEGIYKTNTGEKFVVQSKDNQLMIGALEQKAIDFLTSPNNETKANLKKYNVSTTNFVKQITQEISDDLPFQSNLKDLEKQHGKFQNYELLGTYPVSETRQNSTTYIKLNFTNGTETVRFVRRGDNTPYPLLGNPFPALTPMVPQEGENFTAYYPFLKKSIQIEFKFGKNNIIVGFTLKNRIQTLSAQKL